MFNTVLVGLDLSPAEQPIIDCLPALQNWGVQRVVLIHVIQVGYIEGATLAHEQEYVDWLEKLAQPLRAAGLQTEVCIRVSGLPADEILAAATEYRADLIVIGSRGHNLLSRIFLGSVARAVIRKTILPVLLEWMEPTDVGSEQKCEVVCKETLRHVLLATDFSGQAARAEQVVFHLATKTRRVDCLHVMEPTSIKSISSATATAAIAALVERIHTAGSEGEGIVLQGKASAEIVSYATRADVSLIVVGKHGQNPLANLVIGSTATNLCEIAGRPVLIIP
jgi:nucleotide-binding universal stress UspA family protein